MSRSSSIPLPICCLLSCSSAVGRRKIISPHSCHGAPFYPYGPEPLTSHQAIRTLLWSARVEQCEVLSTERVFQLPDDLGWGRLGRSSRQEQQGVQGGGKLSLTKPDTTRQEGHGTAGRKKRSPRRPAQLGDGVGSKTVETAVEVHGNFAIGVGGESERTMVPENMVPRRVSGSNTLFVVCCDTFFTRVYVSTSKRTLPFACVARPSLVRWSKLRRRDTRPTAAAAGTESIEVSG